MPVADGARELRAREGVLSEGLTERRRELQSVVQIRGSVLPPGRLSKGPTLPKRVA